jgi:site-specific DNA-methyltransferase (adenine-specific)
VKINRILHGDVRQISGELPGQSVHCIVTSPPYWRLRDYGIEGQIGLEPTPDAYVASLVAVFAQLRRVLRDDGTLWLNLGDSYAASKTGRPGPSTLEGGKTTQVVASQRPDKLVPGLPQKNLIGIPWKVAFALQADGWYLRSDIVWDKPNVMPESVQDRPTRSHEYLFLLTKSAQYYYDQEAIKEAGRNGKPRNRRTVWTIPTQPYLGTHFAVFAPALVEPCVLAGCPPGGVVLDPFLGSGTTALVAIRTGRNWLGVELNPEYVELARERIRSAQPTLR